MIKRILSRAVDEEEWPIWRLPLMLSIGFVLAGGLFYGLYFGLGLSFLRGLDYNPSNKTYAVKLEVGGTLFAVPANYTRNAASRRAGQHQHMTLHALLPNLTGYQLSTKEQFLRVDDASPLVIISISGVDRELPNERRFDSLYAPYIELKTSDIENDLQAYQFGNETPYRGKDLFRAMLAGSRLQRAEAAVFICETDDKRGAICETRYSLGPSAEVSYLFKRRHLSDWQSIDTKVKDLIKGFRSAARIAN